jgi:uncharacterized protein (TIGR02996 family)
MTHEDAFLQAIIESPDDDVPRLVFADWLDDHGQHERAEFIRVQCELARAEAGEGTRSDEPEARERELVEGHGREWAGRLHGLADDYWFRRGFVEEVEIDADALLAHAPAVFASAPVRHARLRGVHEDLAPLAASPWLARLRGVGLSYGWYQINDGDLAALATLPPLLRLLESLFVIECHLSEEGLRPLVCSPHLLCLRSLHLSECWLHGEAGVRPLADSPRLGGLTELWLDRNGLGDAGAGALAGSANCRGLTHLGLAECEVGDAGAEALARSPHLGRLTGLYLAGNEVGDAGAAALAGSTSLAAVEYLHLRRNRISDAGARAFAASPHLGGLRGLVLDGNEIGPEGAAALRARFGTRVRLD